MYNFTLAVTVKLSDLQELVPAKIAVFFDLWNKVSSKLKCCIES